MIIGPPWVTNIHTAVDRLTGGEANNISTPNDTLRKFYMFPNYNCRDGWKVYHGEQI